MTEPIKTMDIKIVLVQTVEVPKKTGKGHNVQMSVTFENLTFGKTDGKKLYDWATVPEVWNTLKAAKTGDIFEVTTQKNAAGFIDWIAIKTKEAVEVVQAAVARAKTPTTVRAEKGEKVAGTWDEKNKLDRERFEFDKTKQGLIIRQSCLSTAVSMLAVKGMPIKPEEVVKVATYFENYVLSPAAEETTAPEDDDDFPS